MEKGLRDRGHFRQCHPSLSYVLSELELVAQGSNICRSGVIKHSPRCSHYFKEVFKVTTYKLYIKELTLTGEQVWEGKRSKTRFSDH